MSNLKRISYSMAGAVLITGLSHLLYQQGGEIFAVPRPDAVRCDRLHRLSNEQE